MFIKEIKGYELEKEKPNTSEDFFNRSEVTYEEEGVVKTLHVLYVRYFDDVFSEFIPYKENPLFKTAERDITFKDIVALVCLIKNPGLRHSKRIYLNSKEEFAHYFKDIHFPKLEELIKELIQKNGCSLRSPLELIMQPK